MCGKADHQTKCKCDVCQDGQQLGQLHPADAKRFCDTIEQSLRVTDSNIRTLQSDVTELTDGQHSHADTLQHRSLLCSLH